MAVPTLNHLITIPLLYGGDCSLLGIDRDLTIYVEEIYGADGWLAQHAIRFDGTCVASVDENYGAVPQIAPLPLPKALVTARRGWHTMSLNYSGPRHRGLRGPERLNDLVRPFSIPEKLLLAERLALDIAPPMLLGLAESFVLAEAQFEFSGLFVVCRRVRIAYALAEERLDANNMPYDYDTIVRYSAHFFDPTDDGEISLADALSPFNGIKLHRPMDCLIHAGHLIIADGGSAERRSAIHIWRIDEEPSSQTEIDRINRKIYGT
jgi:hypothetical protein